MCLMWSKDLIDAHQVNIVPNKIIHLDGAHCKASKFPKILEQAGYLALEIIIQNSTIIRYFGMHGVDQFVLIIPPIRDVDFETIIDTEGKILNIANFQPLALTKGTAVNVIGEINLSTGLLTINCQNSSDVQLREDIEPLTDQQLRRGTRIHKRRLE
ncbi:hypothetical protein TSAR_008192 [Trichomalopsis sarcophagae]|uniref:Uncharacterized protein n=1 Tax=Trichomalopsis sarcophagae TaxID=543379 RepID=A0A232EIZ2_9HYME|nr:hypothetical protein TSAR_008192 [Trichomalopsis sarcophagae]